MLSFSDIFAWSPPQTITPKNSTITPINNTMQSLKAIFLTNISEYFNTNNLSLTNATSNESNFQSNLDLIRDHADISIIMTTIRFAAIVASIFFGILIFRNLAIKLAGRSFKQNTIF